MDVTVCSPVCSLQATPATSIREEAFLIHIRLTVYSLPGPFLNVLQHAERDVAVVLHHRLWSPRQYCSLLSDAFAFGW